MADSMQIGPGKIIGGYTLQRCLGSAEEPSNVYLAQGPSGDTVALKVLPLKIVAASPTTGKRFLREARSMFNIQHPNLVACLDAGEDLGTYYLIMEYVPGKTLRTLLQQRGGPLNEKEALEIAIQVAQGIEHLNQHQLVHRHIKPEHILITDSGQVKLTGFGLIRPVKAGEDAPGLTALGQVVGTAQYMSPEQASGKHDLDVRSDLYSLGIVLYEMLCGQVPFDGPKPLKVAISQIKAPLPSLQQKNPNLSPAIVMLVENLLAKNRDERYANAQDVVSDLRSISQGQTEIPPRLGRRSLQGATERPVKSRPHQSQPPAPESPKDIAKILRILVVLVIILTIIVLGLVVTLFVR